MLVRNTLFWGLLLISTAAVAEDKEQCIQPTAPGIPSGRTATQSEMLDTMDAVKTFIAAGNQYRECINRQVEALNGDKNNPVVLALVEAYQDSLDTEELLADTFNTQLRIFKSNN